LVTGLAGVSVAGDWWSFGQSRRGCSNRTSSRVTMHRPGHVVKVIKTDIVSSNGVIHVIDSVVLPKE
jgi:hypothetical protein